MDELATRLTAFADKYGPQLADTVLTATRFQGYADLVGGVVALVIAVVSGWMVRKCFVVATSVNEIKDTGPYVFAGIMLACVCLFASVTALCQLLDPWTYAAIFSPDVYLVKKAIKL